MNRIHPTDAELLDQLSAIAAEVDPVPADVFELGRAAFATRTLDAELARLVEEVALPAGVRATQTQRRTLTFESGDVVIDVELQVDGDRLQLVGQVLPVDGEGGTVELQGPDGVGVSTSLDDDGGFAFRGVATTGSFRLVVTVPGRDRVVTSWTQA